MFHNYSEIKNRLRGLRIAQNSLASHYNGETPEDVARFVREYESDFWKECKESYKYIRKYKRDPLAVSLSNSCKSWRTVADDFDSCTDFIIIPDRWDNSAWNDEDGFREISEDIEDFVFSTVGYNSCYDFPTGKMITISWHFKRTQCGVIIIHRRGIDW